jgi:hypothetical protein
MMSLWLNAIFAFHSRPGTGATLAWVQVAGMWENPPNLLFGV